MTTSVLHPRPQLSEQVADHLRSMILGGELLPGTHIRMDDMATRLGVSATPIREALLTLRGEGWVRLAPRRGYSVIQLTENDIRDIFAFQEFLLRRISGFAAAKLTDADHANLEEIIDRLEQAITVRDTDRIVACEAEFHRYTNRLVGRRKLVWFLDHASRYTPVAVFSSSDEWCETSVACHRRFVAALRADDAAGREAAINELFELSIRVLLQHLRRAGVFDAEK